MTKKSQVIKIAGFQKNSFIDYPGKIASIIFLGGCNFVCYYCHNNNILGAGSNTIAFNGVLRELKEQVGFVDGVVISGGEPTVHPHLKEIICAIKEMGFLVKLDTNGTNSAVLKELVESKLIDYVAMDVKAPIQRYKDIVGVKVDVEEIKKSIEYLKEQNNIEYMFRTTLCPVLTEEDVRKIGELVCGAEVFQLQQFVPNDFSNAREVIHLPYPEAEARKFELMLAKYCKKIILRGF